MAVKKCIKLKNNKNDLKECKDKDMHHYAIDCPVKKILNEVINDPTNYHITKFKIIDEDVVISKPNKSADGATFEKCYTKIVVEIDLFGSMFFDKNKNFIVEE